MAEIGYNAGKGTVIKERPGKLSERYVVAAQFQRGRQLIDDWLKALKAAENPEKPNREQLYRLYTNLLTDGDLSAEWETKRKLRFTGAPFQLFKEDGQPDEEAVKLLQQDWFYKVLGLSMDSKLWGHSLISVKTLTGDGKIDDVELIKRRHIIPEKGLFIDKIGDEKGTLYREDPAQVPWTFEIGDSYDLGLMAKAAPYVLFMRFALSAWSEYAEKFVMPVRVAKTNTRDTESLNRLDQMMLDMATASYAILNKDEEFEFIETSKTDGSPVFEKLINKCNATLSKLFNGAVIGEASQGGSKAKEQVGQDITELVTVSDFMWFETIMNQRIMPKLIAMGYPFAGLRFEFDRPKDLKGLLEIVKGLGDYFDIDPDWVVDTFGVPVTKKVEPQPKLPGKKEAHGSGGFFE